MYKFTHLQQKLQVKAHIFLMEFRSFGFFDSQYPSSFSLLQRYFKRSLQSWVSTIKIGILVTSEHFWIKFRYSKTEVVTTTNPQERK